MYGILEQLLTLINTLKELKERIFCSKTKDTLDLSDMLIQTRKAPPLIEGPFLSFVYLSKRTMSIEKARSTML